MDPNSRVASVSRSLPSASSGAVRVDGRAESSWSELLSRASACDDAVSFQALARKAARLAREFGSPTGHIPVRVALLGGGSTDLIAHPLELALRLNGLAPELYVAPYNVWRQEILETDSGTSRFAPQVAIILITAHNVPSWPPPGASAEAATELARSVCRELFDACAQLHDRCGTEIVINNLPPFPHRPLGNLSAKTPDDPNNFIRRINVQLGDLAPAYVHLNDVAALVERRGLDHWFDVRLWHEAKQLVAPSFIPELARNTAAVVGGILGRTRKCLVLDLDNTLWGGVVGDAGVDGIELGEGTGVGEAFKTFQTHLKAVKNRGVLLAVCSKNEERHALGPFEEHPEMVLKRQDFVAFKANWDPKSDNLRAIAKELNIGVDSLVFVDDNPAEREEVRQALPEVLVPELPADPTEYPRILDAARCFEVPAITAEDRQRSEMYRGQRQLNELAASTRDLSDFLASLEMEAVVKPFDAVSLPRITQLINKTNQFNLTTLRLTGAEVEELMTNPFAFTRTVRLADRFGDHGLISVLFGNVETDTLTLHGWLMSCRVLKRGVEHLLLNELVSAAKALGVSRIVGTYVPTHRNSLVEHHYRDLGFSLLNEREGMTTWCLDVSRFEPLKTFIRVAEVATI
jgi:FkbH-like protein